MTNNAQHQQGNTLIESSFPISEINKYAEAEKGPGRPPHWEMVFWWTRKPLSASRAVIAAALLPSTAYTNKEQFLTDLFPCRRDSKKTVHNCNPSPRLIERLRGKKLLDPFAGFGSIPLEALRLGMDVTAVELLPTAYVFLKAVLEYPKQWGKHAKTISTKEAKELGFKDTTIPLLAYDVAKWGKWITEQLKNDLDIKELYDEDVAVYIGTWEIKCPVCGRHTPLIGNWWLARVKSGGKNYERLAWMEWHNGTVSVMDLNKELKTSVINAEVKTRGEEGEGGLVKLRDGKTYTVPQPNIRARNETAQCLFCKAEINHRVVNGKVVKPLRKKEGDWYVKWALKQWNENYEKYLKGEITLNELRNSPAKPTLLVKVKVKNDNLEFEPASKEDNEKLWKALEKIKQLWGDPDIPIEELWKYTASGGGALSIWIWGFNKFYKLFNPRQLLTLVKLVKLIREAGKKVEEEKLREGWNKEDAFKYAEAVTTYLAIWLIDFVRYDSLVTLWDATYWGLLKVKQSFSMRGLAMMWNWSEFEPALGIMTFLPYTIDGLSYLTQAVSASPGRVRVLLDDATTLSKLGDEKFDVVVTDPPYADDVPYTELSDFYYVWLKRALSDVGEGRLLPRFLQEAFFDEFGEEITTQWQFFARREVSENEGRRKFFGSEPFDVLLARAFSNILRFLNPNGLLVTYYVAKKPEAWEAFIKALWELNELELVVAYPVATESEESVTARGKASVLGGYVSVWRRGIRGEPLDLDANVADAVAEIANRLKHYLDVSGAEGYTAWVYTYLSALSYLTRYTSVVSRGIKLDSRGIINEAVNLAFQALLRRIGMGSLDLVGKAYLALRVVENERGMVDSDVISHVERAVGLNDADLIKFGLIKPTETGSANVAKRKVFEVLAPRSDTVDELRRVYSYQQGRSHVLDCFRQLQLNAVVHAPVTCSPVYRDDAIALAKALVELARVGLLDEDDPDVKIARVILGAEWWQ
ncbi:DUF1156 domain-containing protein [Vulcanisaeta thermophila]|uniref:DUF1156 domain-containing protein n=1 Tax=Vulcanisaeta thermophila TaxID=867917 RepID=UPI0008534F95|nr:DUF1156 domain-containing protein [Vulcanisaeta thermophila]